MTRITRRDFLGAAAVLTAASTWGTPREIRASENASSNGMKLGLVTYLWGQDMKLPELISACEASGLAGVELRTEHAHGVEPTLSKQQRGEVRRRFADSPVTLVGYGSNAQFHENDPAKLAHNIELTKQYVQLMHDCGGGGVKVKPNGFVQGVPREQTIEQIGTALNEVAAYGQKYGQEIRVEVHGRGTSELPVIDAIFEVADHPNVGVCWNSNQADLQGQGLEQNFRLVRDRLGATVHVRELDRDDYPYDRLLELLSGVNYQGWILLECGTNPPDKVAAMRRQRTVFEQLLQDGSSK